MIIFTFPLLESKVALTDYPYDQLTAFVTNKIYSYRTYPNNDEFFYVARSLWSYCIRMAVTENPI